MRCFLFNQIQSLKAASGARNASARYKLIILRMTTRSRGVKFLLSTLLAGVCCVVVQLIIQSAHARFHFAIARFTAK